MTEYFFFFFLVIILFLAYSFFFGDMGYLKYLELKKNEQKLMKDINQILMENNALKNEIELLKKRPFLHGKICQRKIWTC